MQFIAKGFYILALFWLFLFIMDSNKFVTTVATSTYYYNSSKNHIGDAEITVGAYYLYRYHIGTVAVGSIVKPTV